MKLLLLIALAAAAAAPARAPAKKKKAAPETAAIDTAIKKALDAEQQHIADCVTANAPAPPWALTVNVKLSINGAGQVMGCDVSLEPAAVETTRACVEKALRAVSYPKSGSTLIKVSREWAFAMK
jgi:hypothetical protein